MSAIRDPATITKTGRQMVTAGGDITYTKAVLYGQDISHLTKEQVEGLTSIGDPLVTVPIGISDKNDDGNGTTVVLEATFQNSNLKADLPYKAVGFFAKKDDGDEKLVLVGVATDGAYLAATSPDGVSTDSLDIKIAVAVGDASNVTAVVDPAGSVTPATLNGAINKATHDLTDKINTKADKTDLDSQIGIVTKSVSDLSDTVKANKDDTDKTLATKANKATVESDLATKASQSDLDKTNAKVATKADSEDVDDKISNVTKSVSDLSATVTANQKATDSTLATKANASDVADSLATKADKTDVASDVKSLNDAINTKASQADLDKTNAVVATKANATALADYARTVDVDADLDTKANKTDLDPLAKIADVNASLDTKADKTTVNSTVKSINATLATKASQSDLDKTNATVATKADKTTVDGDVKTLQASIDTKADKTALDDYAKSADLTKLLAGKADSDFSYSKAELDKKLLDLTTTTGGKVDASQVATMIENKADKSDVTKQIGTVTDLVNTKANSTDVTAALDKKDDITDVDAKLAKKANTSDVTDLVNSNVDKLNQAINTKANSSDVYTKGAVDTALGQRDSKITNLQNSALQVIEGHSSDDILSFRDDKVRVYNNCQNVKNLPPMDNEVWFYTVTRLSHGWGSVTVISQDNCYWQNVLNGDTWAGWTKHATSADIDNLTNQINQKANSSDVYSKSDVDGKTSGTFVTGYDVATKNLSTSTATVNSRWIVDPAALAPFADQINQLKGRQNADAPDFNNLTDTGVYYVSDSKYKGMTNGPNNNWGVLVVSNGSNNRISQVYYPDSDVPPWMRVKSDTWHNWIQLSTKSDVQNAVNLANSASNKIDTVLANSYVRKQGMNANGDCVEIKHTGIKQANGGYAFDMWSDDWTASKLNDVIKNQLPSKADKSQVNTSNNLFNRMTDDSTWKAITGVDNTDNAILTSIRDDSPSGGNTTGGNGSAIAFGGGDTKAVLSVNWLQHEAKITSGNGSGPKWVEDVAWKSDINNTNANVTKAQSTADSANTNANGRLPIAGGNMNTKSKINWNGGGSDDKTGVLGGLSWSGGTDWAQIYGDQDNNDNLDLAFDLGDDGSNHFSFRKNGTETSAITSDGHYTGTVDWGHVNGRPDVATKSDVNSTNATIATLSQTVQSLKVTLDSATATIKSLQSTVTSLQDTVNTQATTITGLQTQVNNQAQDIAYIKANYIEGKRFSKADEASATAWEKENSQRIAFITDN